jgi:hypothetical protein
MAGSEKEYLGYGDLRRGGKEVQGSRSPSKYPMVEDGFGSIFAIEIS